MLVVTPAAASVTRTDAWAPSAACKLSLQPLGHASAEEPGPREQRWLGHPARGIAGASSLVRPRQQAGSRMLQGLTAGARWPRRSSDGCWPAACWRASVHSRCWTASRADSPREPLCCDLGVVLEEIDVKNGAKARGLRVRIWQKAWRRAEGLAAACAGWPGNIAVARRWQTRRPSGLSERKARSPEIRSKGVPRESRASPARVPRPARIGHPPLQGLGSLAARPWRRA
jgi:hypothetical protein